MANNDPRAVMKKEPVLDTYADVCEDHEAIECAVLINAAHRNLAEYNKNPTQQKKKDYDAARAGLDEIKTRLQYKYDPPEQEPDDFEHDESKPLLLSTPMVADFFGVTQKCVTNDWKRLGCPQVSRGIWNLKAVFHWWWENIAAERAAAEGGDASLNEAKRQYWWARVEAEQIRIQKEKDLLLSKSEIEKGWAWRMSEYKSGCENLEHSLPPLLEGKNQAEMRKTIGDYVWNLFDRVCREGGFSPEKKLTEQVNKKTGPKKKKAVAKKNQPIKKKKGK